MISRRFLFAGSAALALAPLWPAAAAPRWVSVDSIDPISPATLARLNRLAADIERDMRAVIANVDDIMLNGDLTAPRGGILPAL